MLRLAKIAALVSLVVLANAVTTLLFVQGRVPVSAQVGGPCVDGDVNGDSSLDLSDAIYTLQHLFEGGPAPIACAQTSTSMELESVLAQFLPRHRDRFYWKTSVPAATSQEISEVIVVPLGQSLHITAVEVFVLSGPAGNTGRPYSNDVLSTSIPLVQLLVSGEKNPVYSLRSGTVLWQSNGGGSGGLSPLSSPSWGTAIFPVSSGETLEIQRAGGSVGVALYGYFVDAP